MVSRGAALLVGCTLGLTGCMTAARVFLDLEEVERTGRAERTGAGVMATDSIVQPRVVFEPAPIESVLSVDSVVSLLPALPSGGVDWSAAWVHEVIRPRAGEASSADSSGDFAYDLYLSTGEGPEAYFPHSTHRDWLTCESCHPGVYRHGGTSYSRSSAHTEQSCGKCHGPVAFRIQACEQCHEAAVDLPAGRQPKSLGQPMQLSRVGSEGKPERFGAGLDLTSAYPPASFPHGPHRLRYQCRACHERPYPMERGATVMSEAEAHSTNGCGSCHDGGAAFGADLDSCERCHSRSGG